MFDLQTGEAVFLVLGGSAHADLRKHKIWVCPLFEPFLEWLYQQVNQDDFVDLETLQAAHRVVNLPKAEFAEGGYRRPGEPA